MNVLVTGASGFIGRHLVRALLAQGQKVVGCARDENRFAALFPDVRFIEADFATDHDPAEWIARLRDVDAVINAAGIFRERGAQTFEAVHTRGPTALYTACEHIGIRRVIQISALGADEHAQTRYHRSKKAADSYLARLDLDWAIVQPSLVYGLDGHSARLFNAWACLPVIPVPSHGEQRLQPVHIDDAVDALLALLQPGAPRRRHIPFVGPEPLTLRAYLLDLRAALKLPTAACLSVPLPLVRLAARIGEVSSYSLWTREALAMLLRGNTAEAVSITALLRGVPRRPREFIETEAAGVVRRAARLQWLLPLLSGSIALVWLVSGIVSLGVYPRDQSYALLNRVGLTGAWASAALYGAAALDLAIGIAILVMRRRRWLWLAQIVLIVAYSAIIAWALPQFWLHPFGPLIKNVPMLVGLLMLLMLEDEWNT
jgi:uncharacterized protein YbjT (DUF2867 family)